MAILRRFQGYVTAIVLLFTIVSAAQAKYSGGTGEHNNPYQIATAEDLIMPGDSLEDYDKHFILIADVDPAKAAVTEVFENLKKADFSKAK